MIHTTQSRLIARSKILALGMLLALMVAMLVAAGSAHATTTFTVNSTADYSDANLTVGACDTGYTVPGAGGEPEYECTLRAAMEQANYTPGADTINFAIPGIGVKTISPASELPVITEALTINGYSQPGAKPNQKAVGTDAVLKIELSGAKASFYMDGLVIGAANSTVKGLVINDFAYSGIILTSGAVGTKIEGNFIGTDPSGQVDIGNRDDGVTIPYSDSITVGGTSPAARNLISGNSDSGVDIRSANNIQVRGNLIGTKRDGTTTLGNEDDGLSVSARSSTIGGNTVAFNGGDGVEIHSDTTAGNRVLSNSIFSNGEQGIDLEGTTANDPGDLDAGPNGLQNYPVLSSARKGATGTTSVRGKLNSTPNKTFLVQFFSNPEGTDEGKRFIGQRSVTTDSSGNASFTFSTTQKITLGQNITATATSRVGNTSEFSAPRTLVAR
jgi:trimeric autotransporter adhesin